MTNSGRYWEVTGGHHANYSVDILLDPELHASFCRRGRRRLKEIQMSSRAQLKFDRQRGVLRVGGSEAQVAEVQRQLECLGGPQKQICTAAWTELMRTRMSDDANGSVVLRIQQLSNCRVHIERTSKEVRLFGPKPGVAAASQLLDDLQQLCIETLVEFDESQDLTEEKIQQIAQQECVTIKFGHGQDGSPARATILGFEFAVSSALRALEAYEANPMVTFPPQAAEKAAASIAAALAKLSLSDESSASSSGSTTKVPAEDSDSLSEGAEEKKEEKGNTKQEEQGHAAGCSCPTCGATNFCVSCGSANEQYQMYAMQMKAMQMGGQMMMPAQGMVPNMQMAAMPGQVMVMPMNQMMAPMQGIVQPNMQPMGQNMGMVNANMMQAVCMPMQMQGASPEASGDGQVYFVPAQMVPQSMMGDGQKQSFCM